MHNPLAQVRDLQEELDKAQLQVKQRTELLRKIRADNNSKPKLQQTISNIIGKPVDKTKDRRPRNKKEERALIMDDTVDGDYTMEKRFHEGILREVKSFREHALARDYRKALHQMDAFDQAMAERGDDLTETALDDMNDYWELARTERLLKKARERADQVDLGIVRAGDNETKVDAPIEEENEEEAAAAEALLESKAGDGAGGAT